MRKEGWLSKRGEGGAAKFTKRWCVHHRNIRCRCMRMHTHTPCTRHAHAMHTPYTRTRTRHAHAHVHVPCICRRCVLDSGYRLHSYKDKAQATQAMAKGHGHARPEQVRGIISTAAVSCIRYTPTSTATPPHLAIFPYRAGQHRPGGCLRRLGRASWSRARDCDAWTHLGLPGRRPRHAGALEAPPYTHTNTQYQYRRRYDSHSNHASATLLYCQC